PAFLRAFPCQRLTTPAICLHEARTASAVSCEFHNLPPTAPDVLKSCLYLFIEQALGTIFRHSAADADVHVCAKSEADKLEIELVSRQHPEGLRVAEAIEAGGDSLRQRVDALGGVRAVRPHPDQP